MKISSPPRYCRFCTKPPRSKRASKLAFQAFEGLCPRWPQRPAEGLIEFALPGQFPQAGQEIFLLLRGAWTSLIICVQIKADGEPNLQSARVFHNPAGRFPVFAGFLVFHNGLFMV